VDGGALHTAGSVAVEAAGLGVRLAGDNLQNPSNGELRLPTSYLAAASTVAIKPNDKSSARTFQLHGLNAVLSTMQTRGCAVS
jgi:hypothetical protein